MASAGERADILIKLSHVESQLGRFRLATEYAVRASKLRPESIEVLSDVMARLRVYNMADDFLAYVERLGPPSRMPIPVLLATASELSFFNLQDRALEYVEEAFRGDPDYPPTLLALAQVCIYMGYPVRALNALRRSLQRAPEIPETYLLLSQLGKSVWGDVDVAKAAEQQLSRIGGDKASAAMNLAYALHRFHDGAAEYDQAYARLAQGMRIKRDTLRYESADSRRLIELLKQLPTSAASGGWTGSARQPVFIVGMHRSGTTLLEQLLSAHSQVHGIGELYDFTSAMRYETDYHSKGVIDAALVERTLANTPDYPAIGKRYLDGLEWRLGPEPMFTDKLPSNFLNIGFIAQALPNAKILHMVRDPVETCFSNLRELFSEANPYSYDQIEVAEYYAMYRELMAHWKARFPGRILDVDYTRLTRDPGQVMREVAEFCGLEFEQAMLSTSSSQRSVATASAMQVREGVVRRDTPKWKPYERHLLPLTTRLQELGVRTGDC
ncbi:tetratricopeptide repeat-containing sulfotransferase family protein [Solilutibacter silvestris]|uniref:tetratricopeptide repeat-containing sulfotransferase family protein n=1 Tax=Solilutibacter silvestris TaxID=1645665 RepID=UPI0013FDE77A|nr:sulfotransferase family protein [Lysobacter silvestris]